MCPGYRLVETDESDADSVRCYGPCKTVLYLETEDATCEVHPVEEAGSGGADEKKTTTRPCTFRKTLVILRHGTLCGKCQVAEYFAKGLVNFGQKGQLQGVVQPNTGNGSK